MELKVIVTEAQLDLVRDALDAYVRDGSNSSKRREEAQDLRAAIDAALFLRAVEGEAPVYDLR